MIFLLAACAPVPQKIPLDVVLVSMDTVRYDHTSLGGVRDTTPNLAALARMGTWYRQAYAVGNESLYSHAALFTGLYPSEVAIPDYASFAVPDGVPTLAGVLSAYGYHTAAFTGGGHIVEPFGFNKGFSEFHAASGATRFASFFDSVPPAIAWIHAQPADQPWFVFVHGYDAHTPDLQRGPYLHPWRPNGASPRVEGLISDPVAIEQLRGKNWFFDRTPDDFVHAAGRHILSTDFYRLPATPLPGEPVEVLTDAEVGHLRDHYDSGLFYGDLWLGRLLSQIDFSHTLVVVVSDHGEDVLDHGYMNHRAGLWDSTLHVPFVIAGPGFSPGKALDGWVDLRSVVPTVLTAVGAMVPAGVQAPPLQQKNWAADAVFAEGVMDMVSARGPAGRLVVHDAKLATGGLNFSAISFLDPRVEFFPLDSDQPLPPAPSQREAVQNLWQQMVDWRARLHPATVPGADIPPDLKKALQERGYWTPEESTP